MSYETKPGTWTLFAVKERKSDKHPSHTGTLIDEEGREYFLDAWVNESKSGQRYFSGKLKAKVAKPYEDTAKTVERFKDTTRKAFDISDDIPF